MAQPVEVKITDLKCFETLLSMCSLANVKNTLRTPYTVDKLNAFLNMLNIEDEFLKRSILSWFFWINYDVIPTELSLKKNSANCMFSLLQPKFKSKVDKLFMKVITPEVASTGHKPDPIIVDNVNGLIINLLRDQYTKANNIKHNYFSHYMTFCDSFLFYTEKGGANNVLLPIKKILDTSVSIEIASTPRNTTTNGSITNGVTAIGDKRGANANANGNANRGKKQRTELQSLQPCQVAISKTVEGNSLANLLQTCVHYTNTHGSIHRMSSGTEKFLNYCFIECNDLFDAMKYLGSTYGMVHNDLHLGNILVQPQLENSKKRQSAPIKLVVIDYGRMCFQQFYQNKDEEFRDKMFQQMFKMEPSKKAEDPSKSDVNPKSNVKNLTYVDVALLNKMTKAPCKFNKTYAIHITDLITFSANIYLLFLVMYKDFDGPMPHMYSLYYIMEMIMNSIMIFKVNEPLPEGTDPLLHRIKNLVDRNFHLFFPEKNTLIKNYNQAKTYITSKITELEAMKATGRNGNLHNALMEYINNTLELYKLMKNIAEGLYLMALFLIHGNTNENETFIITNGYYDIPLKDCKIFYIHFQCRLDNKSFINLMSSMVSDKEATDVSEFWIEIKNLAQKGGKKNQQMQQKNKAKIGGLHQKPNENAKTYEYNIEEEKKRAIYEDNLLSKFPGTIPPKAPEAPVSSLSLPLPGLETVIMNDLSKYFGLLHEYIKGVNTNFNNFELHSIAQANAFNHEMFNDDIGLSQIIAANNKA